MGILNLLREVDPRLYLGGGVIRNLVWDYLHDYEEATPIDDVDVIYFDALGATKEHDVAIEQKLKGRRKNLAWSVKNQAQMHLANAEDQYSSLEDAVSKWPETCTAVVSRIGEDGALSRVNYFVRFGDNYFGRSHQLVS